MNKLIIGILRETKMPPDHRTPLSPAQAVELKQRHQHIEIYIQPCKYRCYEDEEYEYLGIPVKEDLSNCDILLGIKEVDPETLIPQKTYLFFAHVAKEQPHNRELLKNIIRKQITLIDYEFLKNEHNKRVVAFGRWAGMIGAYKALRARGIRTDYFKLKPAFACHDLDEMWAGLQLIKLKPDLKIIITGEGRAAHGAMETLMEAGVTEVSPEEFLNKKHSRPVVAMLNPSHYAKHKSLSVFSYNDYKVHPVDYIPAMKPYTHECDILIACHYWDPKAPVMFTKEDVREPNFRISVIADVTCDTPGAIPTTLRASTIAESFYGYNPVTEKEEVAFTNPKNITVMAVDNLPSELPRSSSKDFGKALINHVMDSLIMNPNTDMINEATITTKRGLTDKFSYLKAFTRKKK